jgi:hypothetical protein
VWVGIVQQCRTQVVLLLAKWKVNNLKSIHAEELPPEVNIVIGSLLEHIQLLRFRELHVAEHKSHGETAVDCPCIEVEMIIRSSYNEIIEKLQDKLKALGFEVAYAFIEPEDGSQWRLDFRVESVAYGRVIPPGNTTKHLDIGYIEPSYPTINGRRVIHRTRKR